MKRKNRKNLWKELWKESLEYLRESQTFVYIIIALFFLSSIFTFAFASEFGVFYDDILRNLISDIQDLGTFETIWFILSNNVLSAFLGLFLGIFIGIVPVFNALMNGSLLGYVYALTSAEAGFGTIIYLIPHGIFELPAIFIALGLGVKFGMFVFAKRGKRIKELKRRLWSSMAVFLAIILPLLIIAAIIEGFLISLGS